MHIERIDEDELNTDFEISTYRELRDFLNNLPDDCKQLDQPVQFVKSHPMPDEHVFELIPAIVIGTVDDLGLKYVRSSVDNRRHGDELVLFCDANGHSITGSTGTQYKDAFDLLDETKGIKLYPVGHDDSADWSGPAQKLVDQWWEDDTDDMSVTERAVLKSRLADNRKHYPDKANHGE